MTDSTALRRFPDLIRGGNGITVAKVGNAWQIGANLDALNVTPTGQSAPVSLRDTLAYLITNNPGTSLVSNVDDGFYDVPGSGGTVSADDGYF